MKKITLYIITGLVLILCTSSCNNFNTNKKETLVISIIEDITEPDFIASPDPDIIYNRFGLNKDLWKSAHFRYATISQLDYNFQVDIVLPSENEFMGNSLFRRKQVSDFKIKIDEVLAREKDSYITQTHSPIFVPLLRELQFLSDIKGDRKELILFSDLKENSSFYSWYLRRDYNFLSNNIKLVIERFLEQVPQDFDVTGVSLQIIYVPYDAKDNQEYMKLVQLYKEIFKRLDIPLTISANM